jgi:hypothetical protein
MKLTHSCLNYTRIRHSAQDSSRGIQWWQIGVSKSLNNIPKTKFSKVLGSNFRWKVDWYPIHIIQCFWFRDIHHWYDTIFWATAWKKKKTM